jgi:plasmid stabilization system protein ParE
VTLRLFITRRAAHEIRRAAQWWADNRPAAPGAVRADLQATLNILREQPQVGTDVEDASSTGVRRIYLDRTRYWVYYRVRRDTLEVLSLWHGSRGSDPAL